MRVAHSRFWLGEAPIMYQSNSLWGVSVLITRPRDYAAYLTDELCSFGAYAIQFPTLSVKLTTEGLDADSFMKHELAIFVSRNAVNAVVNYLKRTNLEWPATLKCAAVGEATAQLVQITLGIEEVIAPCEKMGAAALLNLPAMQDLNGRRVIFFDGGGARSHLLVNMLQARGCQVVTHAVVYQRVRPNSDTDQVIHQLEHSGVDFAVLTSVEGAANLLAMLDDYRDHLRRTYMVVYSKRIAAYLKEQGFKRIIVPTIAGDDAVIEAIMKQRRKTIGDDWSQDDATA